MPDVQPIRSGTVLAFDFGVARIGVAVGEAELASGHPLETIAISTDEARFARIAALLAQWQPVALVVGLPTHMDGRDDDATALCRTFGRRLYGRFRVPVYWVDERLTSAVAESLLAEAQVFGRKQKQALDQVAAMAILQTYFESGALTSLPPCHSAGKPA